MPPRARPIRASHRWLAIAAALLLLLIGGGAIVLERIGIRDDRQPGAIPAVSLASPTASQVSASPFPKSFPGALPRPTVPMALSGGVLYRIERGSGDAEFTGLRAYRAKDSRHLWEVAQTEFADFLIAGENAVYAVQRTDDSGGERIVAYDARGGNVVWSIPAAGIVTGLTEADGMIYAVDSSGSITAVDARSGKLRWATAVDTGGNPSFWSQATVDVVNSSVIALTAGGTIVVLQADDGEIAWTQDGYDPATSTFAATPTGVAVFYRQTVTTDQSVASERKNEATPTALGSTAVTAQTMTRWGYTKFTLGTGAFSGSAWGMTELTAQPVAIGNVIAAPAYDFDRSASGTRPPGYVLNGISTTWGMVAIDLPAELQGRAIVQLGRWTPPDGAPEQFVAVTRDGILALLSPRRFGPADNTDVPDPYDGAVVELRQSIISQPIGDENDLWVTMADGTLASIHPLRLANSASQPDGGTPMPEIPTSLLWELPAPETGTGIQTVTEAFADGTLYRLLVSNGVDGST
ncbi:MAG: PQQ-binding-like beta-propeller repeat protein, partial [Thermomicrobiales bacterium]|nr:PQQ-binding-like beta-propeller repeat protein [Thermomicrobiales bacterium]